MLTGHSSYKQFCLQEALHVQRGMACLLIHVTVPATTIVDMELPIVIHVLKALSGMIARNTVIGLSMFHVNEIDSLQLQ